MATIVMTSSRFNDEWLRSTKDVYNYNRFLIKYDNNVSNKIVLDLQLSNDRKASGPQCTEQ